MIHASDTWEIVIRSFGHERWLLLVVSPELLVCKFKKICNSLAQLQLTVLRMLNYA
jgi:hypothetical protein